MDRHSDGTTRFPGEEVDKPEGRRTYGVKPETELGSRAVHKHEGLTWGRPGLLCSGQS